MLHRGKAVGWHHSLLMSKHIAGPYGAESRDHVIRYGAERDIGEGAEERDGWRNESVAEQKCHFCKEKWEER